jgi:hypothetical protein
MIFHCCHPCHPWQCSLEFTWTTRHVVEGVRRFRSIWLALGPIQGQPLFFASRRMHFSWDFCCTFIWELLRLVLWIFLMILNQLPPEWYNGRGRHRRRNGIFHRSQWSMASLKIQKLKWRAGF